MAKVVASTFCNPVAVLFQAINLLAEGYGKLVDTVEESMLAGSCNARVDTSFTCCTSIVS